MWETLFDPSMLGGPKEIAIWCPNKDDANQLCEILEDNGAVWNGGDSLRKDPSYDYNGDMVYFVQLDLRVLKGPCSYAEEHSDEYFLCRFDPAAYYLDSVEVEDLL